MREGQSTKQFIKMLFAFQMRTATKLLALNIFLLSISGENSVLLLCPQWSLTYVELSLTFPPSTLKSVRLFEEKGTSLCAQE